MHDVQQLGEQLFAARDRGKRLDTGFVEHIAGVRTGLQHELVVGLCEVVENLRGCHRVGRDAVNQRTDHLVSQAGKRGASHCTTDQGVLEHAQIHARLAGLLAQHGEITHFDATVFGDRDRLGGSYLSRHLGDDSFLVVQIETHQVLPPIKS